MRHEQMELTTLAARKRWTHLQFRGNCYGTGDRAFSQRRFGQRRCSQPCFAHIHLAIILESCSAGLFLTSMLLIGLPKEACSARHYNCVPSRPKHMPYSNTFSSHYTSSDREPSYPWPRYGIFDSGFWTRLVGNTSAPDPFRLMWLFRQAVSSHRQWSRVIDNQFWVINRHCTQPLMLFDCHGTECSIDPDYDTTDDQPRPRMSAESHSATQQGHDAVLHKAWHS